MLISLSVFLLLDEISFHMINLKYRSSEYDNLFIVYTATVFLSPMVNSKLK